jgi:hypothetical protein
MDVCEACNHPVHRARKCPASLFGERCACDEPLAPPLRGELGPFQLLAPQPDLPLPDTEQVLTSSRRLNTQNTEQPPIEVRFFTVNEEETPEPEEYVSSGCTCPPGDTRYTLAIEEGGLSLVHTACGKSPGDSWGDWADLVYMEPMPVTADWVPDCDGQMWHGMDRCEDGATVQVTPQLPEPYRLALSQALGLGTGAPWEAIRERAEELGRGPGDPVVE